jgi:sulfur-carrier protein
MTIKFWIPRSLTLMTDGRGQVEVEITDGTLREALEALFLAYPAIRDRILTEQGEIREHVNVFVGNDAARSTGGLGTPVVAGVEISIIPAISGG